MHNDNDSYYDNPRLRIGINDDDDRPVLRDGALRTGRCWGIPGRDILGIAARRADFDLSVPTHGEISVRERPRVQAPSGGCPCSLFADDVSYDRASLSV